MLKKLIILIIPLMTLTVSASDVDDYYKSFKEGLKDKTNDYTWISFKIPEAESSLTYQILSNGVDMYFNSYASKYDKNNSLYNVSNKSFYKVTNTDQKLFNNIESRTKEFDSYYDAIKHLFEHHNRLREVFLFNIGYRETAKLYKANLEALIPFDSKDQIEIAYLKVLHDYSRLKGIIIPDYIEPVKIKIKAEYKENYGFIIKEYLDSNNKVVYTLDIATRDGIVFPKRKSINHFIEEKNSLILNKYPVK